MPATVGVGKMLKGGDLVETFLRLPRIAPVNRARPKSPVEIGANRSLGNAGWRCLPKGHGKSPELYRDQLIRGQGVGQGGRGGKGKGRSGSGKWQMAKALQVPHPRGFPSDPRHARAHDQSIIARLVRFPQTGSRSL